MRVKKLEWTQHSDNYWLALIHNLSFSIAKHNRYAFRTTLSPKTEYVPTLQEAQAAAQAALEEYVKSFCEEDNHEG